MGLFDSINKGLDSAAGSLQKASGVVGQARGLLADPSPPQRAQEPALAPGFQPKTLLVVGASVALVVVLIWSRRR